MDRDTFRSATRILYGLLFNIYINDFIFQVENTSIYNYAGNTTFCPCDSDLYYLILRLRLGHDLR